jgi:hypothetical protein
MADGMFEISRVRQAPTPESKRLSSLATPPPHMSVGNPICKAKKVEWGPVSEINVQKLVRVYYI